MIIAKKLKEDAIETKIITKKEFFAKRHLLKHEFC